MIDARAKTFRRLHDSGSRAFLLPNAWDAMSARALEAAGAEAIGTTSAGVSWSYGRPDGQTLSREEMIEAVRRIVDAVRVPVTADIEGGYGRRTPADVAETVRQVVGAGVVGINLEDSPGEDGEPLLSVRLQADRVEAARAAAVSENVSLFVNARIDAYLLDVGDPDKRLALTLERASAFVDAGADGVFVPGLVEPRQVRELADGLGVPLNLMAGGDAPDVDVLSRLGVRRISLGSGIAQVALSGIVQIARAILTKRHFSPLRDGMPFAEANAMFERH